MKSQLRAPKRVTAIGLFLALAFGIAPLTYAQSVEQASVVMDDLEWTMLGYQLAESLESPIDQIKEQSLQHITFFATNYSNKVDLDIAVPELLKIYESDKEDYRILALTALHAIGNTEAMAFLSDSVQDEQSTRVRELTLAALAEYAERSQTL